MSSSNSFKYNIGDFTAYLGKVPCRIIGRLQYELLKDEKIIKLFFYNVVTDDRSTYNIMEEKLFLVNNTEVKQCKNCKKYNLLVLEGTEKNVRCYSCKGYLVKLKKEEINKAEDDYNKNPIFDWSRDKI